MDDIKKLLDTYRDANLRDLDVLIDLRHDLQSVGKKDIVLLEDHMEYLRLLQAFRSGVAKSDKLKGENYPKLLSSLLSVGEDGLYSNDLRFMFELIQNVDDCDYEDLSDAKLDVRFDCTEGKIILTYNETGFTPQNVFNITGIAEAAKNISPDKIEIGEKGIGFKSVFGVADRVCIQSGKFSFELLGTDFTVPIPQYENFTGITGTRLTLFVRPKKVEQIYKKFVDRYCTEDALFNKNPLLFLNKLTELHLYKDASHSLKFSVSRSGMPKGESLSAEEDVIVSVDLQDAERAEFQNVRKEVKCLRYTQPVHYTRQMCQARYGENTDFPEKKMYVYIVVPVDDVIQGKCTIQKGTLYSFLPTQIRMEVPFACHIPFKLNGSREFVDSQDNNSWFVHSCDVFQRMLCDVYLDLAQRIKEKIVYFLPHEWTGIFSSDNGKADCLMQGQFCGRMFLDLPIFYTVNGNFGKAEDVFCFANHEEIADPVQTTRLLCETRELFASVKIPVSYNPGIAELEDVNVKLFKRAMRVGQYTGEILDELCRISSFPFKDSVDELDSCVFSREQIKQIILHNPCYEAFKSKFTAELRNSERLLHFIEKDGLKECDICEIDRENGLLYQEDFDRRSHEYFERIHFRYAAMAGIPEGTFFAAGNCLILSAENTLYTLSEFCRLVDRNGAFSAVLRLRSASSELNDASSSLSTQEYMKLLRTNRTSIRNIFGERVYQNYIKIINDAGADPDRYVNELLQNADDCKYGSAEEPAFSLTVSPDGGQITTEYNENGFTKENVRAITAIGESTKKSLAAGTFDNAAGEIGEKGIGFKSVFGVANAVEIHSGEFHFMLKDSAPTVPDLLSTHEVQSGTKMVFQLKKRFRSDFFTEQSVLRLCLCLRRLKKLNLGKFAVTIQDTAGKRVVTINGKKYELDVFDHTFIVNDRLAIEERENKKRHIEKRQHIRCYIPRRHVQCGHSLYTGLPTRVTSKIPVVIDAPFDLTTSRDEILDNRWNRYIASELHFALAAVINARKQLDGIRVLRFLNFKKEGNIYIPDLFSDPKLNGRRLVDTLMMQSFLPTYKKGYFAKPSSSLHKLPEVAEYLIGQNVDVHFPPETVLKYGKSEYDTALEALGVKETPINSILVILERYYKEYMTEAAFRKALYAYFCANRFSLHHYYTRLRSMSIVPIKSEKNGEPVFIQWCDHIYVKDSAPRSAADCYILDTKILTREECEMILGVRVNELNDRIVISHYQEALKKKLNGALGKEKLYMYLLNEFHTNRKLFTECRDLLVANIQLVPFMNECGEICKGNMFSSNEEMGYFTGTVLPKHIIHKNCAEFARFLSCRNISGVYFDDLNIQASLNADDIESLRDDHILNGFAILEQCRRRGYISEALINEYNLGGLASVSIEYDVDSVLNEPVINYSRLESFMNNVKKNSPRIESREVLRKVQVVIPKKGNPYELDRRNIRALAIKRYRIPDEVGYCVCQMCKKAKQVRYIEVNNVQRNPVYYWEECGISLCLECSKHYEELRSNEVVHKRFINAILSANWNSRSPVEIPIGNEVITFSQTHIAQLQKLLR